MGVLDDRIQAFQARHDWLVPSPELAPWADRLSRAGFHDYGPCRALARETNTAIDARGDITVREVRDETTLRAWHHVRRRVARAAERGRREVLTVARADTSVPMLMRMGFSQGGPWSCWERPGAPPDRSAGDR